MYLLDVLGDMCAVRAVAASEIAAVHACLLAEGGEHQSVRASLSALSRSNMLFKCV